MHVLRVAVWTVLALWAIAMAYLVCLIALDGLRSWVERRWPS